MDGNSLAVYLSGRPTKMGRRPVMIIKKPRRTMVFFEQDEDFIKKLAGDIGCHYLKANERTYNLCKSGSNIPQEMGVFAWIHKEENEYFWVATRKIWVEEAKAKAMAGRKKRGINCFPRDKQHAEDSVCFDTKVDYDKAVEVLSLINKLH
jgi:hypothetical protein